MIREVPAREFALLIAMLTAMAALAIDAMLPALAEIGNDLGVVRENNRQLVISALFLGFALGQIVYGPLSDRFGRKPGMYVGLGLFVLGCVLSMAAWSYPAMLAGRFLQGIGAAGPRIVCLALVRDRYEGREMARVMSFIFAVFVIVPTIAPALGQVILLVSGWRAIFGALLVFAMAALFPAYFAALSLAFAASSYMNGRLVVRHGMRKLAIRSLQGICLLSAGFVVVLIQTEGLAPLWMFLLWGAAAFFCLGAVFGNVNALAMEPFGHIAGIAAALIGSFTSLLSMLLGASIGQFYDGTLMPLVGGFAVLGIASLGAMSWAGRDA